MSESMACAICKSNATMQGAKVRGKGEEKAVVICGLHLTPDGTRVLETEASGDWEVLENWGYEGAVRPGLGPLELYDELMTRLKNNSSPGDGWKIVVEVGAVHLETSVVPRGNGYSKKDKKNAVPSPAPSSGSLTNEEIFGSLEWKSKYAGNTVPALFENPWAWAFVSQQDGTQEPIQEVLETAIRESGGKLEIGEFTYSLGGTDDKLFNRKKKEEKKS